MGYLIAKKYESEGCLAVKVERGKALADLVSELGRKTLNKNIQILTVSDMEAFGEYRPYQAVESIEQFVQQVLSM